MAGYAGSYGYTGQQVNQSSSMIVFINDDSITANYPVAPGMTVALINLTSGKMYIKSTAVNGMPNPARIFSIQEELQIKPNQDVVSRQDFDSLSQQVMDLKQLIVDLTEPSKPAGGNKK